MQLNKGCIDVLNYMRNKDDYVTIGELVDKYNVTDRTIRYKVDKIEEFLLKNNFTYLERKHKLGVKLPGCKGLLKFLDDFLGDYTPYEYNYSHEERFQFIAIKILQSSEPIQIKEFETKLCISKNTVLKELDEIQVWLRDRELSLIRKPRVGILVEGNEIAKRKAIREITKETVTSEELMNYICTGSVQSKINNLQFDSLFSNMDLEFLDGIIRNAEEGLNRRFSDESYGALIIHLAIMIKRVSLGRPIYSRKVETNENNKREYEVSDEIIKKLEKHYEITIPDVERDYIVIHLLGAKVLRDEYFQEENGDNFSKLYDVVNKITEEVESFYEIKFQEERKVLLDGLVLHLRSSVYRIKYKLPLTNPLYNEVKLSYSELFKVVSTACRYLKEYVGEEISNDEISYIVIHYAAAIKNYKQRISDKPRIMVVCGSGIGSSKILMSRLQDKFKVQIIDCVCSREIKNIPRCAYDYLISTIDIPELASYEYLKVNPMLFPNDYKKLEKYLGLKPKVEECSKETQLVKNIMNIVDKYCSVENRDELQYEIMYALKGKNKEIDNVKKVYNLSDFIKNDTLKLKCNCRDYKEALLEGCNLLINRGDITKEYYEEILRNLKDLGPYMVIAPGICLAHAKISEKIKGVSMSLINLKYPVKFNHELNDPVKLILTFATDNDEDHLNALNEFMEIIVNNEYLSTLLNASSKEEVLNIINKYKK